VSKNLAMWVVGTITAAALLTTGAAAGPKIAVEYVWARPLPPVVESAELYMVIRNSGTDADRLVGASSPACGMMMLYERYRTSQGTMSMRETGPISIPAGQRVELKVNGHHLMCMERKHGFKAGASFPVTLKFEKSGDVKVQLTVQNR
jgi:copper(I)-binding protein